MYCVMTVLSAAVPFVWHYFSPICFQELQSTAAAHHNQTSYGNDCISSATTSPLILLFIQQTQSSGLLGK